MIKVTPYKMPYYNKYNNKNNEVHQGFSSNQVEKQVSSPDVFSRLNTQDSSMLWVGDKNIVDAINHLSCLVFDENDVRQIRSMGVVVPFSSGEDAVSFIKKSNIRVKFAELSSANIHAQYDFDSNYILINNLYKDTKNPAEILAISEAILHEAGHAKDQDGASAIQEEIDCLSMNALAHRVLRKDYPGIFENENSLIVKDGVCIYADLFFDSDPSKRALAERLRLKYGHLPVGNFKHPPSELAFRVKTA